MRRLVAVGKSPSCLLFRYGSFHIWPTLGSNSRGIAKHSSPIHYSCEKSRSFSLRCARFYSFLFFSCLFYCITVGQLKDWLCLRRIYLLKLWRGGDGGSNLWSMNWSSQGVLPLSSPLFIERSLEWLWCTISAVVTVPELLFWTPHWPLMKACSHDSLFFLSRHSASSSQSPSPSIFPTTTRYSTRKVLNQSITIVIILNDRPSNKDVYYNQS